MKYFVECGGDGAVVGVGGHYVAHVGPPFLADFGVGDFGPALFIFDLYVTEEPMSFRVVEYGIIVGAMGFQGGGQFCPDGLVALGVFIHLVGMNAHYKGFANHGL